MTATYTFRIPIGDWSSDGHGQCDWYTVTSNKPVEAVREAFFAAQRLFPQADPTKFCDEYEDGAVPDETIATYANLGLSIDEENFSTVEMADVVIHFLKLGDPELVLERVEDAPSLAFYGYDKDKRHIDCIGYGLLGN
jgi:hypothetical protein